MKNETPVRDAAISDHAEWRVLRDQYNAFYGRAVGTALPEDIVQSTWRQFFEPGEPVHCLIAEGQGQVAGLAHFIFHCNTITIEVTCYLQDLFSAPVLRGKGIGRRLIMEFYARASQAGTTGVYWHTHAANRTAMRLYDRVAENTGFVVYREKLPDTSK